MTTELTQEGNLLIQTYFTTAFLRELANDDFLNSDYYKNMNFQDKYIKDELPSIGIENQGSLLIFLYTMLVIPKELLTNLFNDDFNKLNEMIEDIKSEAISNYNSDEHSIDYIRHIRNSIAHARVEFISNKSVIFKDNNNTYECTIEIPLSKIGLFLTELQKIFFKYIQQLQQNGI
jgi:hypothetical protein